MNLGTPIAILREKFQQSIGLPFAEILAESKIAQALEEEGISYRKRLFCPIVTLWAWLSQVLERTNRVKSCQAHGLVSSGIRTSTAFDGHGRTLQSQYTAERKFSVPTAAFDRQTAS